MATKDSALRAKHVLTPAKAMTAPALAGPMIRALWTTTEFSETALTTRSAPTSSMTKLWRVGLSTALTVAAHEDERPDDQRGHRAGDGEREERERRQRHERLGDHEHAPLGQAIGQQAAPGAEEQDRHELQPGREAHGGAAAGELDDEPHLGHVCIQLPETETIWPAK